MPEGSCTNQTPIANGQGMDNTSLVCSNPGAYRSADPPAIICCLRQCCPVKPTGLPVMYYKDSPCACVLHVYAIMDFFDISSMFEDVRRMNKRQVKYAFKHVFNVLSMKRNASCTNTLNLNSQLFYQGLNFAMIVSSALMIWKGLMVVTGSESPIVVVLR